MRKLIFLLVVLLLAGAYYHPASAQRQPHSQAVYCELLGPSQGIGFSYDARFKKGARDGFGIRAGLGLGYAYSSSILTFDLDGDIYNQMFRLAVPLEINYLVGKKASKFEVGAGTAICADRYTSESGAKPETAFGALPYLSLGYRLVTDKGFLFRAGVLPFYNFSSNNLRIYPYLSFGWAF